MKLTELRDITQELEQYCSENNIPIGEVEVMGLIQRRHTLEVEVINHGFMVTKKSYKLVLDMQAIDYPDISHDDLEEAAEEWPELWSKDNRSEEDYQMDDPDNKRY